MKWLELGPDALSLVGGAVLTWPALRAGRMMWRAAQAGENANEADTSNEPTGAGIFRDIQRAYAAKSWKPSDQIWLWSGLALSSSGGIWAFVNKCIALAHPIVAHQ